MISDEEERRGFASRINVRDDFRIEFHNVFASNIAQCVDFVRGGGAFSHLIGDDRVGVKISDGRELSITAILSIRAYLLWRELRLIVRGLLAHTESASFVNFESCYLLNDTIKFSESKEVREIFWWY